MATLTSKLIVSLTDMVSGPARSAGAALDRLQGKARAGSAVLGGGAFAGNAVRNLMAVGAGYVSLREGIGGTVGAAIKFEEAFADVRKVVDGTPAQLSAVRAEILAMSKDLPVTAEGMADIYAAAGQSGVALQELGKFSEMAAKVSVAWDTAQGETGEALAKIKTQLGLSVSELGLYADAINHLSNNTASAAPDLVDFAKRVAATGKMFGFQSTETLAFGAAMVSAGAESEVAATSFRNMGRALTKGAQATKAQREAYKRLGLDAVKTAKGMQKNALNTTLDVIERIQKLPEFERNSIASALFGDEARALMPIIADTRELRRELGLVGSEANYAGSAFNEYLVRSETTANALQLIGNKFRAVGIGIGDSWLPTIKELGLGLGDVLDTLGKRVGIIDEVKASMSGLMGGLGYGGTGGARELINDIGDLLFGKAFEGSLRDADERVIGLARLSNRFRGIGEDLRSFADNVAGGKMGDAMGNVGDALSKMSGGMTVAGALAIALTGRALLSLAAGAGALALSKTGRIFIAAIAIATLIDAVRDAESIGEFADNIGDLSAIEWAGIGAGILMLVGPVARLAGVAKRLSTSLGLISAAGGVAALSGGGKTAPVPGIEPTGTNFGAKPPANRRGPWGEGAAPGTKPPKAGPTGPRGLGPQMPSAEAAGRSIGESLKHIGTGWLKGLGAAAATWAGEAIINDAFRATGANPDTIGTTGNAKALWDNLLGGQDVGDRYRPKQEDNASSFVGAMKWLWQQLPSDLTRPVGRAAAPSSDDGGSTTAARQKVDELNTSVAAATAEWPVAAQAGIKSYVDAIAAGGGQAKAEADRIGTGIKDALSVTGQPQVDTAQLSRALDLARQLGNAMRNLAGANVAAPRLIDGQRAKGGPVQRGRSYLVGEEGPEILTADRSGYIWDARTSAGMMASMAATTRDASAPAAPADVMAPVDAVSRPASIERRVEIDMGGVSFTIHAAPGQSPEAIADAVERRLSDKLNALGRGAYSDGAN